MTKMNKRFNTTVLKYDAYKELNETQRDQRVGYEGFLSTFESGQVKASSGTFRQLEVLRRCTSPEIFGGEIIYV